MRISMETLVGGFIISAILVFFYMSYQLGSFRFDRINYNSYSAYFTDVSGLGRKSDVKIAGVKAGWIDELELVDNGQRVRATLMISKRHVLHSDAYAILRQEGLLGSKHLEVVPGDPTRAALASGAVLERSTMMPATCDDVIQQFAQATEHIKSVCMRIDSILSDNQENLQGVIRDLREAIPQLSKSLQHNAQVISEAVDRDCNRVATEVERGVAPICEVVKRLKDGKGVLGQLLTDEQTSDDIRTAISGIRGYFDKFDKLKVLFDMHTESMGGPIEGRPLMHENKTYCNMRLHPSEDYFYVVGLISTRNGQIRRYDELRNWYNDNCHELIPGDLILDDNKKLHYARYRKFKIRSLDTLLFNVQFGKIFGNFAFRFGLFDSTGGVGMDIDIPFGIADLRWVTTFEAFDFSGVNRFYEDTREDNLPHLKWLNRMFVTKNMYCTFGADDFISRFNKNAFFGIGLRFVDDDIKYLVSRITVMAPTS